MALRNDGLGITGSKTLMAKYILLGMEKHKESGLAITILEDSHFLISELPAKLPQSDSAALASGRT